MFITLLLAKNCPELSYTLHYIIQASYKHKMCIQRWHHMQTTLCSFVCCCYWNMGINLLYSIEGIQINIMVAMYNLLVVQITDFNLNVQTKQEWKKSEQKLNLQATNKLVFYGSLYFNVQILFGLLVQIHCRIFEQKVQYKTCLLIGLFLSWQKDILEWWNIHHCISFNLKWFPYSQFYGRCIFIDMHANPLSPKCDQNFHPKNINTESREKVMRIYEMINVRKNSLIFPKIFLTYFLRKCTVSKCQNQSGEFVCGYWGLKGLNNFVC